MKKFLSLAFLISTASPLMSVGWPSLPPFPKWTYQWATPSYWEKSPSVPATTTTKSAASATEKNVGAIIQKIAQAPQKIYSSAKDFSTSHPTITKVTLAAAALIAFDQIAKKTSAWYRENLAMRITFGEKNLHQASQSALNSHKTTTTDA